MLVLASMSSHRNVHHNFQQSTNRILWHLNSLSPIRYIHTLHTHMLATTCSQPSMNWFIRNLCLSSSASLCTHAILAGQRCALAHAPQLSKTSQAWSPAYNPDLHQNSRRTEPAACSLENIPHQQESTTWLYPRVILSNCWQAIHRSDEVCFCLRHAMLCLLVTKCIVSIFRRRGFP